MKLNHFTKDIYSAKSIISSQQLWMGKTGNAPKDKEEIFHYFNLFNSMHNIIELEDITKDPANISQFNTQDPLYTRYIMGAAQSYYMKINKLRIGDILASIVRDESYIVCFTEETEEDSVFHTDIYGPICFHFSGNPIIQDKKEFVFMQAPILYVDTERLHEITKKVDEAYNLILSTVIEFIEGQLPMDKLFEDLRRKLKDEYSKEVDKVRLRDTMNTVLNLLSDTEDDRKEILNLISSQRRILEQIERSKVAKYLQKNVANQRESSILKRHSAESLIYHKRNATFKSDNLQDHFYNIISCFIKDFKFQDDKEVRIIALPLESYINYDETILKVSYDIKKLDYISVSVDYPNRKQVIKELKNLLESLELHDVEVRI